MFQHRFLVHSFCMTSLAALFVCDPISSVLYLTVDFDDQLLFEYNQVGYKCAGMDIYALLFAVCRFHSRSHIFIGSYV